MQPFFLFKQRYDKVYRWSDTTNYISGCYYDLVLIYRIQIKLGNPCFVLHANSSLSEIFISLLYTIFSIIHMDILHRPTSRDVARMRR